MRILVNPFYFGITKESLFYFVEIEEGSINGPYKKTPSQ